MRSAALVVALLVLACLPAAPAVAVVDDDRRAEQIDQQRIRPVSTDIVVSLRANGSARWTVTTTYGLDSETERTAFDAYRSEFEQGSAPGLNADLFETLAAEGSASADRPMRIRNVEYRTDVNAPTTRRSGSTTPSSCRRRTPRDGSGCRRSTRTRR